MAQLREGMYGLSSSDQVIQVTRKPKPTLIAFNDRRGSKRVYRLSYV